MTKHEEQMAELALLLSLEMRVTNSGEVAICDLKHQLTQLSDAKRDNAFKTFFGREEYDLFKQYYKNVPKQAEMLERWLKNKTIYTKDAFAYGCE